MQMLSDETLRLIKLGLQKQIYQDEDLTHAINTIFNNKPEMFCEIYKNTRAKMSMGLEKKEASEKIRLEIINKVILNLDAFKVFINDLPRPANMTLKEFELIINYTFMYLYNDRGCLADFIGQLGGKTKLANADLSDEIKEELNSYLIANKLTE